MQIAASFFYRVRVKGVGSRFSTGELSVNPAAHNTCRGLGFEKYLGASGLHECGVQRVWDLP